jgi:hypothetical protein
VARTRHCAFTSHRPARSRSLKDAYYVAMRSAAPPLDPASVRLGFGTCEKGEGDRATRPGRWANSVRSHGADYEVKLLPHHRRTRAVLTKCTDVLLAGLSGGGLVPVLPRREDFSWSGRSDFVVDITGQIHRHCVMGLISEYRRVA